MLAPAQLLAPKPQEPTARPFSSPHPITAGFATQPVPQRCPVWGAVSQCSLKPRSTAPITTALPPPDTGTE